MKRIQTALLFIFCLAGIPVAAQNSTQAVFAESFRQGATRVTEQSLEIKLDPRNANYRERIKDLRGSDRYEFMIVPQGPEGDTKITSWQLRLRDLHHAIYDNILRATQETSSDAGNNLGWLNPDGFSPVPIRAQRIIRVDSFYVLVQVKGYHFTPVDSPYLDSMTVEVKFSNTDPRQQK